MPKYCVYTPGGVFDVSCDHGIYKILTWEQVTLICTHLHVGGYVYILTCG